MNVRRPPPGFGAGTTSPLPSATASSGISLFAGSSSSTSAFGDDHTSSSPVFGVAVSPTRDAGFGFSFQTQTVWGSSSSLGTASSTPAFGDPSRFGSSFTWQPSETSSTMAAFGTSSFGGFSSTAPARWCHTAPAFSTSASSSGPSMLTHVPMFDTIATGSSSTAPLFSVLGSGSSSNGGTTACTSATGTGFILPTTPTVKPSSSPPLFNSFQSPGPSWSSTGTSNLFSPSSFTSDQSPFTSTSTPNLFSTNSFTSDQSLFTSTSTSNLFSPSSFTSNRTLFTSSSSSLSSTPTPPLEFRFPTRPIRPFIPRSNLSSSLQPHSTAPINIRFGPPTSATKTAPGPPINPSPHKSSFSPFAWETFVGPSAWKLNSISPSPVDEDKSHEELRWEDFQKTNKGRDAKESTMQLMLAMRFYHAISHEELRWADYQKENQGKPCSTFPTTNLFPTSSAGSSEKLFSTPSRPTWPNTKEFSGPFQAMSSPSLPPVSSQVANTSTAAITQTLPKASSGIGKSIAAQSKAGQTIPATIPLRMVQDMSQLSISVTFNAPVQYGISSIPVPNKPYPVRVSPLLTCRHLPLSQTKVKLLPKRYHPNSNSSKVPFFIDEEIPKVDNLPIPRENPRALLTNQWEHWPSRGPAVKFSQPEDMPTLVGASPGPCLDLSSSPQLNPPPIKSRNSNHQVDKSATIGEDMAADIETLLPKLRHAEYFTEPSINELAAKERAEPGYCSHVKDFVVGRYGYGSIKFPGETDVRGLVLDSIVQFNNKEVTVYMEEAERPPLGKGLNKPAVVTLLNIKCIDKKTGNLYTDGPMVEKYKDMLIKKVRDHDAEFLSYEPVKGEWKFVVMHFNHI